MKRLGEYLFLWVVGGMLYYSFEFIFRGFSHWSMFVLGGVCLVFCAWQGQISGMEGSVLSADSALYHLCNSL